MSGDYKTKTTTKARKLEDIVAEIEDSDAPASGSSAVVAEAVEKARAKEDTQEEVDVQYTEADLENFWISILNQEPYVETAKLRDLGYSVRTLNDIEKREIENYMDKSNIKLAMHYEAQEARCIVAYMFSKFGKFSVTEKDNIQARLEKLGAISMPVLDIMLNIMRKFNAKVGQMLEVINGPNF